MGSNDQLPFTELEPLLDRLNESCTHLCRLGATDRQSIDHRLDRMLKLLIKLRRRFELMHCTVDPHPSPALCFELCIFT